MYFQDGEVFSSSFSCKYRKFYFLFAGKSVTM